MTYRIAIAIHVVVAIIGIGLIGGIPLTARIVAKPEAMLKALLRITQVAFLFVFISGVVLDASVDGAFHRTIWFKSSFVMFSIAGFSHFRARVALRLGALDRVERWGWVMTAAVAVVAALMEVKPGL